KENAMRALVLGGAGAVCQETTRDLAKYSTFEDIVVADFNLPAVEKLLDSIRDERLKPLQFDANDTGAMRKLFPKFDIVINGLPYAYDLEVNRACVETGVDGLDLSSSDPQFELDGEAQAKDMLFVPGMGATPGITNMMVKRASEQLDEMDEVEIYFAAFRCLAPAPGLLQTTLWEFDPGDEARQEVFFQEGKWYPAAPLSGGLIVRFHPQIGEQKVYYVPHDEAYTLPRSFSKLRRAAVRGCFPPQVMELMGALMRGGMLSQRQISIQGITIPAIEAVRHLLLDSPLSRQNDVWGYGLVVEVSGERNGRRVRCTYRSHHPPAAEWGGQAAYFKNVGLPLSIGAQMIASGEVQARGVKPPELVFPCEPFFHELAERGITVEETILEEGMLT
ncbi:MAG: saccharopine dehydrogenase family protein, partial [Anaerolineales bacterium]